ncbi:ATP-binding protein [Silicimonas sp. MF1-12-2]|uniref:ATP-binding protein n=1 Tax=Silicimonas sp. MF1-12-2 TaxID=3384793 RepID=UPI0039B59802
MTDRKGPAILLPLASDFSERFFLFLTASGAMLLASVIVPPLGMAKVFLGAGIGLFALAIFGLGLLVRERASLIRHNRLSEIALRGERCPALLSDHTGRLMSLNGAASRLEKGYRPTNATDFAGKIFGIGTLHSDRCAAQAFAEGHAGETVSVGARRLRIEVCKVSDERLLWRFDQRCAASARSDVADRVALLSVSPDGGILGGNDLASSQIGEIPATLALLLDHQPFVSGNSYRISGRRDDVAVRLVELRNSEGWREIALLPAEASVESPIGKILSESDLLDALPVPMLKVTAEGDLIEANHEARSILSLGEEPLPPLFELVEGMGRPISDWLEDAAKGRGLLKPEIVRVVGPGQELFLQITLGRTMENDRTVLFGILNDATELKTLEAQFVQSQKMQAIGQLAGGVAHDFNNLLTAISGHCDLLLLRHDPGDPDYSDLMQISQNANRAASLVGQLLAFSRKQNLKPQALDLRDTMSDLAHLLNRLIGERIQLEVVHALGEQVIRADRRQMEQVIVNLVVNARDAMPEGGRISINIRKDCLTSELRRDRALVPPGDYVVIEVKDSGTGISPDGLTKIFEPFYTTKKTGEGTGLGLSTAYGIVKQTGGFIFVDSEIGKGSLFSLYFPSYDMPREQYAEESPAPIAVAPPKDGGVILLVEDEAPVRAFASRALRMRGYTVLEAENAEQALSTLEDRDLKVDVFVTDVIMPGLDGPTWVRRALRERPDTRTVFVSGYSEEGRIEKQARIPNSVFLPKPFSLQQLTSVVNEQFH